jgi:release factor glutamine methyltransferase
VTELPSEEGTVTWRELLDEAVARLGSTGSDTAAADARWIVAECLGVGAAQLSTQLNGLATERGVAHFDQMVTRRATGEPLQYVLGSWSFRTLDLMVDARVLIPRPETETTAQVALDELDRLGGTERTTTVVDLGTGSGAIALSVAVERVRTQVWATDASADALAVAAANLAGIGRPGARVRLAQGDWFDALPAELAGTIDLVVTNPPYVATDADVPAAVTDWEPSSALFSGPDGTDDLRHLLDQAPSWLTPDGVFVAEFSPEQADLLLAAAAAGFEEVSVEPDLTGRARVLVARRPRR